MTKTLSVEEFRALGLLQEVNRKVLHPMGLALSVECEDGVAVRFGQVIDCRDDPEGFRYDELSQVKLSFARDLFEAKAKLGWHVQPGHAEEKPSTQ